MLAVNAVGAFLLCALLARDPADRVRLLVGTGLLGGFTTASGLALEVVLLGDPLRAVLLLLAGGLTLVAAGTAGLLAGRR